MKCFRHTISVSHLATSSTDFLFWLGPYYKYEWGSTPSKPEHSSTVIEEVAVFDPLTRVVDLHNCKASEAQFVLDTLPACV